MPKRLADDFEAIRARLAEMRGEPPSEDSGGFCPHCGHRLIEDEDDDPPERQPYRPRPLPEPIYDFEALRQSLRKWTWER